MSFVPVESLASIGYDGYVPSPLTRLGLTDSLSQYGNQGMVIRDRIETFPGDAFTQYYTTAVQILYYYDYILTLPDEVPFTTYPFYHLFTVV